MTNDQQQGSSALSAKAVAVMEMIAQGHSYDQILQAYPAFTYHDIFEAAEDVLKLANTGETYADRLEKIRQKYPRAYENWTDEEEGRLTALVQQGHNPAAIAEQLQRQPSAIRSRLVRLGLLETPGGMSLRNVENAGEE